MDYRRVALVLLMLTIVGAAYSGYWFFAAVKTERLVERLASGEFPGYRIAHSGISTDGFPFAIRLHVEEPAITTDDRRIRWGWNAAILELQPWNLRRYRLAVFGPHRVDLGLPQDFRQFAIDAAHAVVVAELNGEGSLARAEVNLRDVKITDSGARQATAIAGLELRLSIAEGLPDRHTSPSLEMSFSAAAVALPMLDARPLGSEIKSLRAGLKLLGSIDRLDEAAVDAWRREGGTLELQWLQAHWGVLDLRAVGTATLDDQLRPLAAFTADIRGFAEALDALASMGLVSNVAAATGRAAMSLIAKPSSNGAPAVLTVPLTAQDGGLFLGPLKLARLPSLFR